jgi:N-acetylglucosaminyldiphosphoundecaprenol N-acetyl-beta-D-mannosaminyltransferase
MQGQGKLGMRGRPDNFNSHSTERQARVCPILRMRVDECHYEDVTEQVSDWAKSGASRYICISTVHMVMESYDDDVFRAAVNQADIVAADGMPIVWISRLLGAREQERLFAPDVTDRLCAMAAARKISVGFFGSSEEVLAKLADNLLTRHPGLDIVFAHSPPYRPLTPAEDEEILQRMKRSNARILFVGLGCPKQELWMAKHRGRIPAVMLGVGWAFDVLAGTSRPAPRWMQQAGLEWLYRLLSNPRKLWRRHLKHNPRFVLQIVLQLLGLKHAARSAEERQRPWH